MHHLVKISFGAIFCSMLAFLLYVFLFGIHNGVYKGAIYNACQSAERPISIYYDRYGRQPVELWDKDNAGVVLNSSEDVSTDRDDLLDKSSTLESPYLISY